MAAAAAVVCPVNTAAETTAAFSTTSPVTMWITVRTWATRTPTAWPKFLRLILMRRLLHCLNRRRHSHRRPTTHRRQTTIHLSSGHQWRCPPLTWTAIASTKTGNTFPLARKTAPMCPSTWTCHCPLTTHRRRTTASPPVDRATTTPWTASAVTPPAMSAVAASSRTFSPSPRRRRWPRWCTWCAT